MDLADRDIDEQTATESAADLSYPPNNIVGALDPAIVDRVASDQVQVVTAEVSRH